MTFSTRIKPLDEQVRILRDAFPDLAMPDLGFAGRCVTPPEADGWFATISFKAGADPAAFLRQFIAGRFAELVPFRNDIGDLTDPSRYGHGGFGDILRAMTRAMQGQPDIVLFPGTFGNRHPERCARDVRALRLTKEEFLLGVPDALCLLLTHPERLGAMGAPAIVCGADMVRRPQGRGALEVPVLSAAYFGTLLTAIGENETGTCLSTPSGFAPIFAEHTDTGISA